MSTSSSHSHIFASRSVNSINVIPASIQSDPSNSRTCSELSHCLEASNSTTIAHPVSGPAVTLPSRSDFDTELEYLIHHTNSLSFDHLGSVSSHRPIPNISPITPSPFDHDEDYRKIHTPYSSSAFAIFLEKAGLIQQYPDLPLKINSGFSLGEDFPPLLTSDIPPNLPSADEHRDVIQNYINEELALGRFSGPYTQQELESKIGFFRSSPIQVVVKSTGPGTPDKYRCCRNLSFKGSSGRSVNDEIDSDDYPTEWYTAVDCAKIVSLSILTFFCQSAFRVGHFYFT